MVTSALAPGMVGDAIFSDDGLYRFVLTREWDDRLPRLAVGMLNPSKAGKYQNDNTIRRVVGFAVGWGFGSVEVVNLCAYMSTDPDALAAVADPIGFDNAGYWRRAALRCHKFACAWGAVPKHLRLHKQAIYQQIVETGPQRLSCMGLTKHGHPRHPLYLPKTAMLQSWTFNAHWWESTQ